MRKVLDAEPHFVGSNLNGIITDSEYILQDAAEHKGPLAGLVAALEHCTAEWALIVPVDMPALAPETLRKLFAAADERCDVVSLSTTPEPEPFLALYRTSRRQFWREQLDGGRLSARDGIRKLRRQVVQVEAREALNVNTPEDYRRLKGKG